MASYIMIYSFVKSKGLTILIISLKQFRKVKVAMTIVHYPITTLISANFIAHAQDLTSGGHINHHDSRLMFANIFEWMIFDIYSVYYGKQSGL